MSRVLPILFNTEMVRAILKEVSPKTATRRVIKGFIPDDAIWGYTVFTPKGYISCRGTFADGYGEKFFRLPCQPGDILYVRETWTKLYYVDPDGYTHYDQEMYFYAADGVPDITLVDADGFEQDDQRIRWHPSIHMPKEAARIWLKVTDVRAERLQEITERQAQMEGVMFRCIYYKKDNEYIAIPKPRINSPATYRFGYAKLWNSILKKSDLGRYGWDANPWVWVIEFERCEKPETARKDWN